MIRVAIDFDGTLVEKGHPLRWRLGAKEALTSFHQLGYYLILYTARATPESTTGDFQQNEISDFYAKGSVPEPVLHQWTLFEEVRSFLKKQAVWDWFDQVWQEPGKPHVDFFIDDKFESPDWKSLAQSTSRRIVNGH